MKTNTAEIHLFDTCTHKCAYCHLAETGKVLDSSQTRPFRDPEFISNIANFFVSRSDQHNNWLLTLTGGEPLLMPNLRMFSDMVGAAGNKIGYYSALLIGESKDQFQYLLHDGVEYTDYIMASFHPEAEHFEAEFFAKVKKLKDAGHNIILRMVGHPDRIDRLDELSSICEDLDIAFHPTTMFSPEYPNKYTIEEKNKLSKHFVSLNQYIQLENGLDTHDLSCKAGKDIIAIDMRTGHITPCVTVQQPIMGNIYDNTLNLFESEIKCPEPGVPCVCDIHYQQSIIPGSDDSDIFEKEKQGFVDPTTTKLDWSGFEQLDYRYSQLPATIGQTETAMFGAIPTDEVQSAYRENRVFFEGNYSKDNHEQFLLRQFPKRKMESAPAEDAEPEQLPAERESSAFQLFLNSIKRAFRKTDLH